MPTPIRKPMRPMNEMLRIFAKQAEETMVANNLIKQRVWPTEVYPGYIEENRRRAAKGWSHSTGAGAKSFRFVVTNDDPFNAQIEMSFLSYMRYVDLGVGAGTEVEDVERSKKAHFSRRYGKWIGHQKRVSRPIALMEARHVLKRMRDFAVDFYGYEGTGYIINTFDFGDDEMKMKL